MKVRVFVAMFVLGVVVMVGAAPALAQVELPFTQPGPRNDTGKIATPVRPPVSWPPVSVGASVRLALVQSLADIGLR
ncbi:MAG: hypothetical protein QN183_13080 [Armatimonadota bacterium]|nr:hypothetical protein [Armatimonadota bacterium]MDR7532182.1 hypothetical protein [Armatimonadota bacterium]MDR7537283.1 hypothetical protein [Armatimonadota bacterium]